MEKYLIETALLGHGLPSVTDTELSNSMEWTGVPLVWLREGKAAIGSLKEFLPLRRRFREIARVSRENLEQAQGRRLTAFLTASAAMAICAEMGVRLAVTAGMGGVGPRPSVKTGADLIALKELPVTLLATAPKDVFDRRITIEWLQAEGIPVYGCNRPVCDGFLCRSEPVRLNGVYIGESSPQMLLLNCIPPERRCVSSEQLFQAMEEGAMQASRGREYHPAVNAALDRLSRGESSRLQLTSLCANIGYAEVLTLK